LIAHVLSSDGADQLIAPNINTLFRRLVLIQDLPGMTTMWVLDSLYYS